MTNKITIGLFGTCDNIKWRDEFITKYKEKGIDYFNPDAGDDWHAGMVVEENKHLNEDRIILFPVLAESLGTGSLGEIGFSILNLMRNVEKGSNQYLVVMIDDECFDVRKTDAERKNSTNNRKLVKSKLENVNHPNLYIVNTLKQMLKVSTELYAICELQDKLESNVSGMHKKQA